MAQRIADYVLTPHAVEEMQRRGVSREVVAQVLAAPDQRVVVRPGRVVCQSKVLFETGTVYLVRVFVDVDCDPADVVTVYRTSRVEKYWSVEP